MKSEHKYRDLVEHAGVAVMTDDSGGKVTYVNEAFARMFGYSRQRIKELSLRAVVHPDDIKAFVEARKKLFSGKADRSRYEFRGIRADGAVITFEIDFTPHRENDRIIGSSCYVWDVSGRKRAENDLRFRLEFENIITTLCTRFINLEPEDIAPGIADALGQIGRFTGAERSFIVQIDKSGLQPSSAHQWNAAGGPGNTPEDPMNLSPDNFPWAMTRLNRGESVEITSTTSLPKEALAEKKTLKVFGIQSIILVPMVYSGEARGVLGLVSYNADNLWAPNTSPLLRIVADMFLNALNRQHSETALRRAYHQMRDHQQALESKNIALKEVLASVEDDKQSMREQINSNVEQMLLPVLQRLKTRAMAVDRQQLELLEQYLRDISAPHVNTLKSSLSRLTPREREICHMIRNGLPSKEIATILNVSPLTIHKHRERIRKKLGLQNSHINLSSYLQSP